MGQFEEYSQSKTEVRRGEFLTKQREKGLGSVRKISGDFDYTYEELRDGFDGRLQETSYFERSKYYFEDAGVMEARQPATGILPRTE